MGRRWSYWTIHLALTTAVALSPMACASPHDADDERTMPTDLPVEPGPRLRALMDRARSVPELAPASREEIERLVTDALPAVDAPRRWRTSYVDLPLGDFTVVDLLAGPEESAERLVWAQIIDRPDLSTDERRGYGDDPINGYPTRGVRDHHLFVLAGEVEVRLVAAADSYRDSELLRRLLAGFDLELLASRALPARSPAAPGDG